MAILDLEKMKRLFDKYDFDRSGEINQAEFKDVLIGLLRIDVLFFFDNLRPSI